MGRLPVVSGQDLIRVLQTIGFQVVRQKGSHISLQKDEYRTVIPIHDELAKGTLIGILKQCGLDREAFEKLLKQ